MTTEEPSQHLHLVPLEVGRNVFWAKDYQELQRKVLAYELEAMWVVQFLPDNPSAVLCHHNSCFQVSSPSAPPVNVRHPRDGNVRLVECRLYLDGEPLLQAFHPVQPLVVDEELDEAEKILDELIETDARLDLAAIIRRGIKQGIISNTPLYV